MTSKLKCPFCGERLFVGGAFLDTQYAKCPNPGCKHSIGVMPVEIWQTIIDGKKAQKDLEIATKALEEIAKEHTGTDGKLYACSFTAQQALELIEHKEK